MMLMPLVGVASLLGGSVFWLRRVGWLQHGKYYFSNSELVASAPDPNDIMGTYLFVMRHHASLQEVQGWLVLTKVTKTAVLAAFLVLAVTQIASVKFSRRFTPAYLALFLIASATAVSTALAGSWLALLAGGRSFVAWAIGASATPLVDTSLLRRLARVLAWTLLAEALLLAIELRLGMWIYTIEMFGENFVRVVGTFNLPVSLGTFSVVSWAAAFCWGDLSRRSRVGLTLVLLFVLVFNASATAWVAFAAAVTTMLFPLIQKRWRAWVLVAALPVALLGWQLLPTLTGRYDVQDSLWGRIAPVQLYASEHLSTRESLFGTGFGLGTNALAPKDEALMAPGAIPDHPVGDSMPAVIFWQVGLVGLALVYSLFALALRADKCSRAIGMALLVSSVAVNITELFPVNLVLGFWLANAAIRKRAEDAN